MCVCVCASSAVSAKEIISQFDADKDGKLNLTEMHKLMGARY